jgi:hypothetical protein
VNFKYLSDWIEFHFYEMDKSQNFSNLEKDYSTCKNSILEFKSEVDELKKIVIKENEADAEILISLVRNILELIIKKMVIWSN